MTHGWKAMNHTIFLRPKIGGYMFSYCKTKFIITVHWNVGKISDLILHHLPSLKVFITAYIVSETHETLSSDFWKIHILKHICEFGWYQLKHPFRWHWGLNPKYGIVARGSKDSLKRRKSLQNSTGKTLSLKNMQKNYKKRQKH